ncbi:MAG: DUF4203 domain-containing protein [Propionicimonas sp.]
MIELVRQMWVPGVVVLIGLALCFRGYVWMRWVFALSGAAVGWQLGGLLGKQVQLAPAWDQWIDWGAAILGALLVATVAYAFYVMGVLVAVGGFGYNLGLTIAPSLGLIGWQVTAAAGLAAAALVVLALATGLPKLLMVVLTALVGSGAIVSGTLSLIGDLDLARLRWWTAGSVLSQGLAWNLLLVAITVAGVAVQLRGKSARDLRAAYA